jgi:ATP-dependent RNA helicase DeaD
MLAATGRAQGIQVADLVHAVTSAAGLDGEAVRDVRVLEHFTLFSIPDAEADRVIDAVGRTELGGQPLRVEPART